MGNQHFKMQVNQPWPLVLGLDIGAHSIKYLLLRQKGTGMKVDRFGKYNLDSADLEVGEKVQKIMEWLFKKGRELALAKTVIGIAGSDIVIKRESFPSLAKKELDQTVFFSVQKEMGEAAEAPFVHDFIQLGPDPKNADNMFHLMMGVMEERVDATIGPVVAQGIIPAKVSPTVVALGNLSRFIPDAEKRNIGILDIGVQSSTLAFMQQGKVDFYREIAVGGDDFTRAITGTIFHEGNAIQFSTEEANDFKVRYGYPLGFSEDMQYKGAPLSEVGALMRPVLERLISEIQRSIGFYKDKARGEEIEGLYLIGGGARLAHLTDVLTDKVGVQVQLLPYPKQLGVNGNSEQRKIFRQKFLEQATCLALAMESDYAGNLLPALYKKMNQMASVRKVLKYCVVAAVAFLSVMTFNSQNKIRDLKSSIARMEKRINRTQNTAHLFSALLNQKTMLEGRIQNLKSRGAQKEDIIQMLRLVSHSVPSKLTLLYLEYGIERVEGNEEQRTETTKDGEAPAAKPWILRLRGTSPKPANDVGIYLAQLFVELEKSGYFSRVELVKDFYSDDDEEYYFELLGTLEKSGEKRSG